MNGKERAISLLFFCLALVLINIKFQQIYISKTNPAPQYGDTYSEAVLGELNYLNPVLAATDNDLLANKLIFSSLVETWGDEIKPLVAKDWEISPDALTYKLNLRDDVYFHDGEKLESEDILYTLGLIKDPAYKSPYYELWQGIEAEADGNSIVFHLPREYGAFLRLLDFGIIPSHIPPADFSKKVIGSGPYQYIQAQKDGKEITGLKLERFDRYFLGKPYIGRINLSYYKGTDEAQKTFSEEKVLGLSGVKYRGKLKPNDYSFATAKRFGLVLNTQKEALKDAAVREKILNGEPLDQPLSLTLTLSDNPVAEKESETIKEQLPNNLNVTIKKLGSIEMQDVLVNKDYELLLYGFDFTRDTDLYPFWHSSQLGKMNLSGYSNKELDIMLEDARMQTDAAARKEKYNKIYEFLLNEGLAKFFDPVSYNFFLSDKIKGVEKIIGPSVSNKYSDIQRWYIKEKRVGR